MNSARIRGLGDRVAGPEAQQQRRVRLRRCGRGDQQQPLHRAPFAVAATRTAPDGSFGVREVPKTGVRKARTHPPVRRADVTVLGDVGTPLVPI
jgi:hypothetical protein